MHKVTIPMKLPSCNNYINACRTNKYMASALKNKVEADIQIFLKKLPKFKKPIKIRFIWVSEKTDRRDLDGICFAKKFILDAMQKASIIENDNRKFVTGFTDEFIYGEQYQVILEIEEK